MRQKGAMDLRAFNVATRDFQSQKDAIRAPRGESLDHPLIPRWEKKAAEKAAEPEETKVAVPDDPLSGSVVKMKVVENLDPLSMMMSSTEVDPLSAMMNPLAAPSPEPREIASVAEDQSSKGDDMGDDKTSSLWNVKKKAILREYTLSGSIKVAAGFMSDRGDDMADVVEPGSTGKSVDRSMARLRQLELDPNKGGDTLELSQKQYVERIETLHANLHTAWHKDEKVRASVCLCACACPCVPRSAGLPASHQLLPPRCTLSSSPSRAQRCSETQTCPSSTPPCS